jgi:hypothetical protein
LRRIWHKKAHFCDAHHILKVTAALASRASMKIERLTGGRLGSTGFYSVSADETPRERRGRSVWHLFLDKLVEGRMHKAEREIAEYLQRHGRELPPDSATLRRVEPKA